MAMGLVPIRFMTEAAVSTTVMEMEPERGIVTEPEWAMATEPEWAMAAEPVWVTMGDMEDNYFLEG